MSDNSIENIIARINSELVVSHNIPENFFVCKKNKDSKSVWLTEPVTKMTKKLAFNYKSGKKYTFTVKNKALEKIAIPDNSESKKRVSDRLNTYISFTSLDEYAISFIKDIAIYYVENFEPSDKFGCCSKYQECSKAQKCLHENLFYSKACWYRKNLEKGKIFY